MQHNTAPGYYFYVPQLYFLQFEHCWQFVSTIKWKNINWPLSTHLPFKKCTATSGPCGQDTSKVLISRCLWQEQRETSAKLASRMVPYDRSHVEVKGSHWPQTPNIIFALYLSSLASRNNVGHVWLPLLIGPPGPAIFKWTQLIKLDCVFSFSCFTCDPGWVNKHLLPSEDTLEVWWGFSLFVCLSLMF